MGQVVVLMHGWNVLGNRERGRAQESVVRWWDGVWRAREYPCIWTQFWSQQPSPVPLLVTLLVSVSSRKTHPNFQGQVLWCQNKSIIPSKAGGPAMRWCMVYGPFGWTMSLPCPTFLTPSSSNPPFHIYPSDSNYDITSFRKLSFPPWDWIRSSPHIARTALGSSGWLAHLPSPRCDDIAFVPHQTVHWQDVWFKTHRNVSCVWLLSRLENNVSTILKMHTWYIL